MKKKVEVIVTGIHSRPGEPTEKVETTSVGVYELLDDGSHTVEYDEEQSVEALDGNKVHNRVHIAPDGKSMDIIRGGAMESRLSFGDGLKYDTEYITPYGTMQMRVRTRSLDFNRARGTEDLKIMAEYVLEMEGLVVSDSMIIIEVKFA